MKIFLLFSLFLLTTLKIFSQLGGSILTKDGFLLGERRIMFSKCLKSMGANENNKKAIQICTCRMELIDRRYTAKQVIKSEKLYGDSGFIKLLESDTLLTKELESCIEKDNYSSFLSVPKTQKRFTDSCQAAYKRGLEEKYDSLVVSKYCKCAVNKLKEKSLTENQFNDLFDQNSLLFNEVIYYCGKPFLKTDAFNWSKYSADDIGGEQKIDTIKMIAFDGMQKLKIKIGNYLKVGLLDCGATDILIPKTFLDQLQKDSLVSEDNYLGIGKYELANGSIIECKKYKLNNLKVGKFTLSNVVIAAIDKQVTILVGRSLLNKFSKWNIDNEKNWLILEK